MPLCLQTAAGSPPLPVHLAGKKPRFAHTASPACWVCRTAVRSHHCSTESGIAFVGHCGAQFRSRVQVQISVQDSWLEAIILLPAREILGHAFDSQRQVMAE
ncbi:hypothetical protein NPIL_660471 [Nephila pilipes]|uniref:Uncharacterized protein n=1 Tax=Nephila pilipes TaxID=299642 RepID=A0A8X6PCI6_NEPPI|nr:hypothetical protein NPIL_660471 [Nephila pilipes]